MMGYRDNGCNLYMLIYRLGEGRGRNGYQLYPRYLPANEGLSKRCFRPGDGDEVDNPKGWMG